MTTDPIAKELPRRVEQLFERAEKASGSNREVYLAFVADPELVLRAVADSRDSDRAEMVQYMVGSDDAPQPLAGKMTLRACARGRVGRRMCSVWNCGSRNVSALGAARSPRTRVRSLG